jgi:arabinan endo-1,5-alpha-L-arabinosidase
LEGDLDIHDPSTIIKCKSKYYIFGTGRGIVSKSSTNKVYWSSGTRVFATAPAWTTNVVSGFNGFFWAPDVIYQHGRYCLYYSVSSWGKQVSAIGLVTNPTLDPTDPAYQWTDRGPVIQSTNGSPYNAIDPGISHDASGNLWLVFGSFWNGIYLVQLDLETGLRSSSSATPYRLAYNNSIEAACIFRHGSYYYLFVNWGTCCKGVKSTYNIRVGRSAEITGPYLDRSGVDMANNGGTLFLDSAGRFIGPGHAGVLAEDGKEWLSYHYYDAETWSPRYNDYGAAKLDIFPLSWTEDQWPSITRN